MTILQHLPTPAVMGILNVTDDSFSDGGKFLQEETAFKKACQMIEDGADIIDIGGESTRPGACDVGSELELKRVLPLLKSLKSQFDFPVSIDTQKAQVMAQVIEHGADMINDVNALQAPGATDIVADSSVNICLMHRQGNARSMQVAPFYENVVEEVYVFLDKRIESCLAKGISLERICVDIGFGFGKTDAHNLTLIQSLPRFQKWGVPLLIGVSRKSTIGRLLCRTESERLAGSLALNVMAYLNGANILRVHDVKETFDALKMARLTKELGILA